MCAFDARFLQRGFMKCIYDSIKELKLYEIILWAVSVVSITVSFLLSGTVDALTLISSLIGVTALIFVAKGNVIGQILTVVFGIFYAIVSIEYHYWSEVITYLGMTAPIAFAAVITWIRHPYKRGEVEVRPMRRKDWIILILSAVPITMGFYFILRALNTPNIVFSTISIATSFLASSLVMLRSQYYGIFYGLNDIVLIVLWVLASIESIRYLPMVLCFVIFLINDLYGFYNWRKIKNRQNQKKRE